jgi:hypothetical protein
MTGFYFQAPTLFEPLATPSDALRDVLHDAEGMAQILARSEKFAQWLALEMKKNGLDTSGPFIDESGWILETACKRGFVVCNVSAGARGDNALFYMLLSRFDDETDEVDSIVEAILRRSTEITELEVERD